MPDFRRYYLPNALVFITTVIQDRRPVFGDDADAESLLDTMRAVQTLHPFHLLAYVVLPEHLHLLMQTGAATNFSRVMHSIKRNYTLNYKKSHGIRGQLELWQSRFWDHVIRDDDDLARHMDYIHYNPVKHGYSASPLDWEFSTYRFWWERGYYPQEWGMQVPASIRDLEVE